MLPFYIIVLSHYAFLVFRISEIVLVGTGISFAIAFITKTSVMKFNYKQSKPVIIFLIFSIFYISSFLWSIDVVRTQSAIVDYAYFMIIFLFAMSYKKLRDIRYCLDLINFITMCNLLTAIYYVLVLGGLRGGLIGIDESIFNITSLLIGSSLICLPFTLYDAFIYRPLLWRKLFSLCIPLFIIIMSQSRGGFLLFPLIIFSMFFHKTVIKKKRSWFYIIFGAFFLITIAVYYSVTNTQISSSALYARFFDSFTTYGQGYAALSSKAEDFKRLSTYLTTLHNISPTILGTGRASFGMLNEINTGLYVPSHSIFIDLYIELGVAGLSLFVLFYISVMKRASECDEIYLRRTFAISLSVAVLYGLLQGIFYNLAFFIFLAIICKFCRRPVFRNKRL